MKTNKILIWSLYFIFSLSISSCEELFGEDEETAEQSSGANCSLSNYNGPDMSTQFEVQCKAAYTYKCAGNTNALKKQCAYYKQLQQSYNLPDCPYCN